MDLQLAITNKNNSTDLVSPKFWKENTPHEIELSVTVQYVGAIDVLKQTFDARLWIDIFWLPSPEEYKEQSEPSEWDLESNLQTQNAIALHSFEVKRQPKIKDIKGRNMYHAVVQLSATFSSSFDLHSFPFDCQKLSIIIEMGNVQNMIYKACSHLKSILSIETQLCVLNEWNFEDANISFTASDASLSKQGNRYSQCIIQLILPRKWESFTFRLVSIISFLVLSLLATYSIDYGDVGDRLGFIFTLLLTLVAFQYTVSSQLPPTTYLTFFDQYFLSSMIIIFINVLTVSLAPTIIDGAGFEEFDIICFYVSMIYIIGIHAFFMIGSFYARNKALRRVESIDISSSDQPKNIKVFKENFQYFPNENDERFCIYKSIKS